ncbi:hypothetical protein BSK66_25515 [Paenibacillus odorifer]|uniref:tail completion protein gp17 n=1 Tax=Paenibacillus TaxID=44249 RepID=UPI0003E1D265|nr:MULTISPECIES: DUF3168 domain-containing protein [Paenibacillus]ETT46273.1 hypothetical protein C171_28497 [Paenibacillus sp. FSL H8-237]OME50201.1 hypothetical protein BSK66_25515 [Paenibacillus odorifer]
MAIETKLRDYLLSIKEIQSVVGNRIHPGWLPEKPTYPAIAYLAISGVSHHNIPVAYPRFQFSVFSTKYGEAKELAEEIRSALQRYKGSMGGVRVLQGVWEGSRDMYESGTNLYHIATDFKIIYREE